jgi:hypothetical protein
MLTLPQFAPAPLLPAAELPWRAPVKIAWHYPAEAMGSPPSLQAMRTVILLV